MTQCQKSIACGLGTQKTSQIWECFFAFNVRRENTYISRLLATIFIRKTESIIFINNFIINTTKLSIFIACNVMQKVLCPKVLVRKKKLPYGRVFLCPQSAGNRLLTLGHMQQCRQLYIYIFDEIIVKINNIILVDKLILKQKAYSSKNQYFLQPVFKAKKTSHLGPFFCMPTSSDTTLFPLHYNDKYGQF